jgi:hypothetical protein
MAETGVLCSPRVCKDKLLEARYFSGFVKHGTLAENSDKLNSQNGPRLWSTQYRGFARDEDVVGGNKLRGPAVLAVVLGSGAIFTLSELALDAVKEFFEFAQYSDEAKVFAEYRGISKRPSADASMVLRLFRSVPEETKWEKVPGTDRLRLTVSIVAVVCRNLDKFPTSRSNEKRYVYGILQKLLRAPERVASRRRQLFPSLRGQILLHCM